MTSEKCKELLEKWQPKVKDTVIAFDKIETTYLTGQHPFMIGAEHVAHAADHYGGMLSEAAIDDSKVGCRWPDQRGRPRCNKRMSDPVHAGTVACYVRVTKPCTQKELAAVLHPIKDEMTKDGIDGFAFLNHDQITDWGQGA